MAAATYISYNTFLKQYKPRGFDLGHLARNQAAWRRGAQYDWEDDTYTCLKCSGIFCTVDEFDAEHDCDAIYMDNYGSAGTTLNDFLVAAVNAKAPLVDVKQQAAPKEDKKPVTKANDSQVIALDNKQAFTVVAQPVAHGEKAFFGSIESSHLLLSQLPHRQDVKEAPQEKEHCNPGQHIQILTEDHANTVLPPSRGQTLSKKQIKVEREEKPKRKRKMVKKHWVESGKLMGNSLVTCIQSPLISIAGGPTPSSMPDIKGKAQATSPRRIQPKPVKKVWMNPMQLDAFVQQLSKILRGSCMAVDVISKTSVRAKFRGTKLGKQLYVHLLHHDGIRKRKDIYMDAFHTSMVRKLCACTTTAHINMAKLSYGSSGLVLKAPCTDLAYKNDIFVVRGRVDGNLVDARSRVTQSLCERITHYTDEQISKDFFLSFSNKFQGNKPANINHECVRELTVQACGEVAALITQAIFPCGKITCKRCLQAVSDDCQEDVVRQDCERIDSIVKQIKDDYPEFAHASHMLTRWRQLVTLQNHNLEACAEVRLLIGDRTQPPFIHVNRLSEILIKGTKLTGNDLAQASAYTLEIARYLNNRTENIRLGHLGSFRNKISAKAHINTALMCDNQLDKNGNFLWGHRGVHAKRFFTNFFHVVDPKEGYEKHIIRKHFQGERHLAIGNLLMSTDFARLRAQIQGLPIESQELGQYCISKKNGNYLYSCCCVTQDDGQPLYSDLKLPTKRHLVVGNTGDSKFIDMPVLDGETMYIAKEGYCYLNIFLAMLVNVKEDEAKDFTKFIRDTIVPKLGKWPTMIDLATACYLLTTLFPDVHNAELPRILVDHANKGMHVLDSYGSLSTNYHVLKMNTVSQLLEFANNNLQSEMQSYRVGGDVAELVVDSGVTRLIKSIYKPKEMEHLLKTEPYMIVLSIVSPSVVLAMYNTGAFEQALEMWLPHQMSLANLAAILTTMAKKVSVAKLITQQREIIANHSQILLDNIINGVQVEISYRLALEVLSVKIANRDMDVTLQAAGYKTASLAAQELVEKNYARALRAAWAELTWLERFRSIRSSSKYLRFGRKPLPAENMVDSDVPSSTSLKSFCRELSKPLKSAVSHTISGFRNVVGGFKRKSTNFLVSRITTFMPDALRAITVLSLISIILSVWYQGYELILSHRRAQQEKLQLLHEKYWRIMDKVYKRAKQVNLLEAENLMEQMLEEDHPEVHKFYIEEVKGELVYEQARSASMDKLEKIIAYATLVMMAFDTEKSDCIYKTLNKLKGIITTVDREPLYFQSLDEYEFDMEEKMTVDFELKMDELHQEGLPGITFRDWWNNQINRGNTKPHYRTEGKFLEFTRDTAASVSSEVAHDPSTDFLIRGAVGSGKSTGLPFNLSKRGRVLMIEPTRPLADNVHKQLRSHPFLAFPTLQMRGKSVFGSSPITIMTSGFALHHFAHNVQKLANYDFVIIDECHVNDSSAMAFRNLLHEHEFKGKVLKVSATPPGREVEFQTQHPVKLKIEESLSFNEFVSAQGTGSNADVVQDGDNILVYVSSYNEVDMLSKLLATRKFKVTKVDGRTMKQGGTEILTEGTPSKKHFIVATNIIENGVTLDIDVVVDFGLKVVPVLDVDNRAISSRKTPISYGERIQRLGRVGRHKSGTALRIGETVKTLVEIPEVVATEAAFMCFMYNLPVTTQNVSTSILESATLKQARTMAQFELPYFYTVNLVRFDGSVHPAINKILEKYKLNNSEIQLNKLAIPNRQVGTWLSSAVYRRLGLTHEESDIRIPFICREIPDLLHSQIWEAVLKYKQEAGVGRLTSAQASKVAYTLQTDIHSISRTLAIIGRLIANEQRKQAHFDAISSNSFSFSNFSLNSICEAFRSNYAMKHTTENIAVLQQARDQLTEYANLAATQEGEKIIADYAYLEGIYFQSEKDMSKFLKLKGHWNTTLITRDVLIGLGVLIGGSWMALTHFKSCFQEPVYFQGKKNHKHKLRMREARDARSKYEVEADPISTEYFFGSAYNNKGKKKGTTVGMGKKSRKFINMYGYDPADFSFVRFVDPLTGQTIDDSPHTSIGLIQEHFGKARAELLEADELDPNQIRMNTTIHAYMINSATKKVLKVDLTPHRSMRASDKSSTIMGFPEREDELRQTGQAVEVPFELVPKPKEDIIFEGASLQKGVRDYNPISSSLCHLQNESDGEITSLYGIGFGPLIITNKHLFRKNNGSLSVVSAHGVFRIKNSITLQMHLFEDRDMVVLRMPKDFPPFPQKLKFRQPAREERICMVTTNFQTKSLSSMVSESSCTFPTNGDTFWMHWITTKDGQCGSPLVSVRDGCIVGIHSASNFTNTNNYFTSMPPDLIDVLTNEENRKWTTGWKYNADSVLWGGRQILASKPKEPFQTSKVVTPLDVEPIYSQHTVKKWVVDALHTNLRPVADCPSQLVTKHVVKGKCTLFELYLKTHPEKEAYFRPLMGAYKPSRLNKEAFLKDLLKYSTEIEVGNVNCDIMEQATVALIMKMRSLGFPTVNYVTDESEIFGALNMKAAVGALYKGKKSEFFKDATQNEQAEYIKESCRKLYMSEFGVWNGSLKAELRPVEKVELNKTRTFTAAPVDTLLGGKVCVDDFNNHFYNLNIRAPWTVGMTKFYGGWDELMRALPDGWVYCDADGSQFDSSLTPYLINAVLQIRLSFMEEWDVGEQMLRNLYTEIVYTPILVPDGTVIKKHKGNNSGQPSTVVDNTLMVILAVMYTCLSLKINQEDIVYFVNGDDLLIAIRPDQAHKLRNFKQLFSELGLKYEFDSITRNREDLWFMSHRAIRVEDIFIPKLEPERIVSILEWDRSKEPTHRLEAICAAMIESWGYGELTNNIRSFYSWVLEQAPYSQLASEGKAPYLAETALRRLYTSKEPSETELKRYIDELDLAGVYPVEDLYFQSDKLDAGASGKTKAPSEEESIPLATPPPPAPVPKTGHQPIVAQRDRDIDAGSSGTFSVPRLKTITSKLRFPKSKGKTIVNLNHLLGYKPDQEDLSNARATMEQFTKWYESVQAAYDVDEAQMGVIMNGLMVWCIENGTSPNINGTWTMMDNEEQVSYPLKPIVENAQPTFRQIMTHFSDLAEAYIEMRNREKAYMPRYGLQRNLNDMSLARYAFDFYELTSKTPVRAREAHMQMKAAAIRNSNSRLFGLDGNVGIAEEDTERHTAHDVNRNMHSLLGMRQ